MSLPIGKYSFRPAQVEDLPHLPEIESASAKRFRDTEYSALADDSPPDVARFQSWLEDGPIWVAVDAQEHVIGFAVAGEVDGQCFLIERDVHPAALLAIHRQEAISGLHVARHVIMALPIHRPVNLKEIER